VADVDVDLASSRRAQMIVVVVVTLAPNAGPFACLVCLIGAIGEFQDARLCFGPDWILGINAHIGDVGINAQHAISMERWVIFLW